MLVLTRKTAEAVVIDGGIRLTILHVGRNTVRLGIEAPRGVAIVREELLLDDEERLAQREWRGEAQNA